MNSLNSKKLSADVGWKLIIETLPDAWPQATSSSSGWYEGTAHFMY